MPIKFRCPHCEQFLGISRSKAGAVTDCPMCGRTLRVPKLDGTIAPLPKPKLNHGDSGLARALDALASLGATEASDIAGVTFKPVEQPRPAPPVAIVLAPAPPVEAVPMPVPLPVPLPPKPGQHFPNSPDSRPTPPPRLISVSTSTPGLDPLQELAALQTSPRTQASAGSFTQRQLILIGGILGLLGIGFGFLLGRMTGPSGITAAPPVAIENAVILSQPESPPLAHGAGQVLGHGTGQGVATALGAEAGDLQLAIEGRLTFVNAAGESRPDSRARILVIPARRQGTLKLPVMSFRAGANEADVRVAQASIRALGGDYTLANPDGRYEVRLPATGKYHLLMVSKYQGRGTENVNDPAGVAVLKEWFDQPRLFFGQTQSTLADVQFDGARRSIRDHVFPKTN